jgi:HD superfamily phosphohydrolases
MFAAGTRSVDMKIKTARRGGFYNDMTIQDKIYGDFEVRSPIALELISTGAFSRLEGICQFGIPDKYCSNQGYSRFEHSVGVYILLNRFGASEEEQIAGLLHDVSHTAFSHLIDWVVAGGNTQKEDFQDRAHLSVLRQPAISNILQRYGYTAEGVADHHRFKLLESEIPDLCADRIDYTLRQFSGAMINACLAKIVIFQKELVFSDEQSALIFADNYLKLQVTEWAGYESCTRILLLSGILKDAIKNKDLLLADFWQTDDFVINKMIKTGKKEYLNILKLLEKKDLSYLPKGTETVVQKFRHVDPKVLINGQTLRLSELNNDFKIRLEKARLENSLGVRPGLYSE